MFSNHFQIGYEMDLVPHLLPCNGQGCLLELGDPCNVLCTLSLCWRKEKKLIHTTKTFLPFIWLLYVLWYVLTLHRSIVLSSEITPPDHFYLAC